MPAATVRVIASPRVSARTRGILAVRSLPDDPGASPQVLTDRQLTTLRAFARVVVPQDDRPVDLALRVDAQLADGLGDGWRPDGLPVDVDAYRAGLDALAPEADRGDDHLATVLDAVSEGEHTPAAGPFDAEQLRAWAEDASVDLAKQWVAHPATMAEIDYDGFANGGDGVRKQGFLLLGAGQREAWEPAGAAR